MSFKLVVTDSGKVLDRYEFEDGKKVVIGRHEDCDVRITSTGISRRHCELVTIDNAHVLRDLGSSNGTFVRGQKITNHALNNGDVFSIVGVKVKFEGPPTPDLVIAAPLTMESVGAIAELTMNVKPSALRKSESGARGRPDQAKGHLVLRAKGEADRNVILQKGTFVIGKSEDADLKLGGLLVPRMVALLIRDSKDFWLLDVSPKGNCVTINGNPTRIRELENGDIVKVLKKATFQFYEGLPRLDLAKQQSHLVTRKFKRPDFTS
jgi:predicted component of type VI protein secretion system